MIFFIFQKILPLLWIKSVKEIILRRVASKRQNNSCLRDPTSSPNLETAHLLKNVNRERRPLKATDRRPSFPSLHLIIIIIRLPPSLKAFALIRLLPYFRLLPTKDDGYIAKSPICIFILFPRWTYLPPFDSPWLSSTQKPFRSPPGRRRCFQLHIRSTFASGHHSSCTKSPSTLL